jgi:ABC-type polysaccharide/polyol phosphate export permease
MSRYRDLIMALAAKEVKIKYKSAVLGWLWSLLHPVLLMIVFSVVFTFLMPMRIEHFPAFLLCALLPWFFFSFSLQQAVTSVVDNAGLIKKTYFPYEVIPLSVVAAQLFNFLISLGVLALFLIFNGVPPTLYWCLLPMVIAAQLLFVAGLCLFVSAAHVMFRDVKYVVELLLLVWFYLTPIFYPIEVVPGRFQWLLYYNPLTLFVVMYRDILLYQRMPSANVVGAATAVGLLACGAGAVFFNKNKKWFADVT